MTPLVFAHRGASADLPEHTRGAYLRAIADGADGFECDVRLTRDGHLVCIHDGTVARTSGGRGRVSSSTLDELRQLDFAGPGATEAARILTLDELLGIARGAGRPVRLLVETKHPSRFGSAVEQRLVDLLDQHGLRDGSDPQLRVTVMSFSPLAVRTVRGLAPALDTVYLFELAPPRVRDGRPPFGAGLLGPGLNALRARPELVARAHERGHQVYVWTVNTAEDVELAVGLGVDGLISDRPGFVLARLGRA